MRFFILSIALFFNLQLSCAQNTLTAELSFPTQINNNKNFTVTLTIKKPENLHSFAVFTQKIPNEIGERRVGKECRSRWSPYH